MPAIIDYSVVLERMMSLGLRCNYPNGGSFGFAKPHIRGWIGPADVTIKPDLRAAIETVSPPYSDNLTKAAVRVWQQGLTGPAWIMPASHWHFELHDGSRDWLPRALAEIQVDAKLLIDRADGSAIEFSRAEISEFSKLLCSLLEGLKVSDFTMAIPDWPVICLVHHHQQLWWASREANLIEKLRG